MKNVSMTMLRKENHTGSTGRRTGTPRAPSAPEMDETGRIVELIRSMPERYREALELRFAWEYSNQEIAKALKLNTSTVATLVAVGGSC